MKQIKLLASLFVAGLFVASCSDEDVKTPTVVTVDFEGSYWTELIDSVQYNGPLLYGEEASTYSWTDAKSQLTGGMTNSWGGFYGFAEGGIAISNYVNESCEGADFNRQLEAPATIAGSNFAVVYCSSSATLSFADSSAHVIQSMQVCPTNYLLNVARNGDGFAKALINEGDYLTLCLTADNGVVAEIDLARDGSIQDTWKNVSLAQLGAIKSLTFTMKGSDTGDYGLNTPAYVAIDNIVIE